MLSIGAFSDLCKVTTNTLRYYDEIGLLTPAFVSESGYRFYEARQLDRVLLINRLKTYGFSLDEVAAVLSEHEGGGLLLPLLRQKAALLDQTIERQQSALRRLNEDIQTMERGAHIMSYLDSIEVRLVNEDPKNILFIREMMNTHDYGKYLGMLYERIAKEKLTPVGPPMTIFHHQEEFNPDCYDNEIAIPILETVKGTRTLSGGPCVTARLKGPYSELTAVYAKLKQHAEANGYTQSSDAYEVYLNSPHDTKPEDFLTEVYFPVNM